MNVSELTNTDLTLAKLTIEIDELESGDPSDSGWISYHEDEGVIAISEYEVIERQPGIGHGGYEFKGLIEQFDEEEVLQEAEKRSIDV
ncbi:hypothetical protein [Halostagnicola sp. A-GB9-2]|uniref:hypothetical protein n=1 Tax=Halostagnicola sp. A-GB9-2 TaxID=3048066 RepID=UPI0024C0386C|nr:hypothetical protein [Halostagnicola sp. A-GB9-2]MDJ1434724.1 hypothetical protein [Halostagnicola sp. A-GB9-2]